MKFIYYILFYALFMYGSYSCDMRAQLSYVYESGDVLPSWNEGEVKRSIISFVENAIDSTSQGYIPVADRIVTFDNDGTLWSEKPFYFQLFFALYRIGKMSDDQSEWRTRQPYRSFLENLDIEKLRDLEDRGLFKLILASHSGYTADEFGQIVKEWVKEARHPRFNRPFTDLVYQPMLELIQYLQANKFKTFIVSGGGVEFMRPWVEEVYGIPKDQVIGSTVKTEFKVIDGKAEIVRLPEIDFINDKEGKPVGINKFIGRRPVISVGNSDGDLDMMEYTAAGSGSRLMLYVHHTDGKREWHYDRNSLIGRLDNGLDKALEKGWTVIDMKEDWKVVYPFEKLSK